MDTATLVETQIDDGPRLIAEIRKDGFFVSGAYWLYSQEGEQWFFYIVSDDLLKGGVIAGYRVVSQALDRLPNRWISPFEIKVVGSKDPAASAIKNFLSESATPHNRRVRSVRFGDVDIDEAYLYDL